jgi:pimeloyl-ACP methyl ester carboxylesterase
MPVVLLHALPLDGSMWEAVRAGLDREVVAPTLYRFGDSLEAWAAGVLSEVGPGPLTVVGNSVGGSCAVEIARLVPDRVRCLVLVGAKPGHRPEPALRDSALQLIDEVGIDAAWARYWAPLFGPRAQPAVIEHARVVARRQGSGWIANGVRAFHSRQDRASWLRSWPGRTVVVRGEYDAVAPWSPASAAELADAQFVEVAGVGHYVPLEDPAALTAILRSTGCAG